MRFIKNNSHQINSDEFSDARAGKIDVIITKSVSRFARNTRDCLQYVRELRDRGIAVIFEKEGINTLDGSGELLLTILSSLAQDESRNISENCRWGIRRKFEKGEIFIGTTHFLGYDKDADGKLVINPEQAETVRRPKDLYFRFFNEEAENEQRRGSAGLR